jgi:hypothetical protein
MLAQKTKTIIVVHDEEIWWICLDAAGDRQWFRQPLAQLLTDEEPKQQIPDWLQDHSHPLCLFPDHWFGGESYPFQSRKPSLIEPFLERKLSAAYPGLKDIRNFFNYRHMSKDGENSLGAVFLVEDKGYDLYNVLQRMHHQPQRITSPALIWEERLRDADNDFGRLGTLLIHHTGNECQLYFYHQGHYLFSRSVMVGDAVEGIDALAFEINQSLYMFSQKAKNELDRVYAVCDDAHCQARLSETLGREVVDLSPLTDRQAKGGDIPGLEPLNDLLQWSRAHRNAAFFSIIQRQVKRTLEWRPVQLTGIILGLILLLCLVGENLFLRTLRNDENRDHSVIETSMPGSGSGIMLSEQASDLAQVLAMAARDMRIDAVYRLPDHLPAPMQLKELDLDLASPTTFKLAAMVRARDTRELTVLLTRVVTQVKGTFENVGTFSLNDIDIRLDRPVQGEAANRYRIAFQLELP